MIALTHNHVRQRKVEDKQVADPLKTLVTQNGDPQQEVAEGGKEGEESDAQSEEGSLQVGEGRRFSAGYHSLSAIFWRVLC